jgi:hypothetical protein
MQILKMIIIMLYFFIFLDHWIFRSVENDGQSMVDVSFENGQMKIGNDGGSLPIRDEPAWVVVSLSGCVEGITMIPPDASVSHHFRNF